MCFMLGAVSELQAKRLKTAIKDAGMTVTDAAEQFPHVGKSTFYLWTAGKRDISLKHARNLGEFFNRPAGYFIAADEGEEDERPEESGVREKRAGYKDPKHESPKPKVDENIGKKNIPVAPTGYRNVPIFGSIPAGNPMANLSDAIDWIVMPEWTGPFERWGRVVTGDSMEDPDNPERSFNPGDIAIFEDRRAVHNNAIHANTDGKDTFKILQDDGDGVGGQLVPMNPNYERVDAAGWTILGVCIQRIRQDEWGDEQVTNYRKGYIWRPKKS